MLALYYTIQFFHGVFFSLFAKTSHLGPSSSQYSQILSTIVRVHKKTFLVFNNLTFHFTEYPRNQNLE